MLFDDLYHRLLSAHSSALHASLQADSTCHLLQQVGALRDTWNGRALREAFNVLRGMDCGSKKRLPIRSLPLLRLANWGPATSPSAVRERWLEFVGAQKLSALPSASTAARVYVDRVSLAPARPHLLRMGDCSSLL